MQTKCIISVPRLLYIKLHGTIESCKNNNDNINDINSHSSCNSNGSASVCGKIFTVMAV